MTVYPFCPLGDFLVHTSDPVAVEDNELYQTAGILSYGRGLFQRPIISGSDTSYKKYNRLHAGQFIYSRLFGWEGALAVVPQKFEGYHVSHEFPTFNIIGSVAFKGYVAHLARWSGLHEQLRNKTTGLGSRRQRVNVDRLLSAVVPLPELDEQRRVAAKLDAALSKIDRIDSLRTHCQRLRYAFALSLISRAVKSSDEPHVPLGDFLRLDLDTVFIQDHESYQVAGILSYGRGLFRRPTISGSDTNYKKYNRLRAGQFVYSKLFGWEGALAVVSQEFDGYHVSLEFPTFDIDGSLAFEGYVGHLARWSGLHEQLRGKTTGIGSRRQRVNVNQMLSATVPLPDLAEQRRIAAKLDVVRDIFDRVDSFQAQTLDALRLSLLNAAFSGQL